MTCINPQCTQCLTKKTGNPLLKMLSRNKFDRLNLKVASGNFGSCAFLFRLKESHAHKCAAASKFHGCWSMLTGTLGKKQKCKVC
jgi:hypothetical protein